MVSEAKPAVMADEERRWNSATAQQDAKLEEFGYEAEMKRSFDTWDMIGFSYGIVNSWCALGSILVIGIASGGPPVMIWGWVGVCFLTLFVAHAFAEMCSAYPIAGGQYSWVAILSPPKYARPLSYITGWIMNIGLIGVCSCNYLICSNYILGMAKLNFPSYQIERWHGVLIDWLLCVGAAWFNVYHNRFLHKIGYYNLFWNLTAFVVTAVVTVACSKTKQSAHFVFVEFQNQTGFEAPGMAVMIGLLQCFFGMVLYDVPSKMTEDMKNPTRDGPLAILSSVWMGAVTGFVYLVILCFCIGDLEATASTSTGMPIIQIFYDATGSIGATTFMTFMLTSSLIFGTVTLVADTSRGLWAFARDNGLPFSTTFARVSPSGTPINAVVLSCVVQMAINAIYFATYQGFATIIAFGCFGFYFSYVMPLLARLMGYWSGHAVVIPGRYSLGHWSPLVHAVGLVFLLVGVVVFCFPQVGPVTGQNMNYCSAAFGFFAVVAVVTWFTTGKERFTGPRIAGVRVAGGRSVGDATLVGAEKEDAVAIRVGAGEHEIKML